MIKEKRKINWSSPRKIHVMHEMTEDMLKKARNQLANLKRAQNNAHSLDETTMGRIIKPYRKQQQIISRYLEQCQQWRQKELNRRQLSWIKEIEDVLALLQVVILEILNINSPIRKERALNDSEG